MWDVGAPNVGVRQKRDDRLSLYSLDLFNNPLLILSQLQQLRIFIDLCHYAALALHHYIHSSNIRSASSPAYLVGIYILSEKEFSAPSLTTRRTLRQGCH